MFLLHGQYTSIIHENEHQIPTTLNKAFDKIGLDRAKGGGYLPWTPSYLDKLGTKSLLKMILTSVSFLKLLWFVSTSYIPLLFLQKAETIRITNNKNTVIYHWQEKLTMHAFQEGSRKSWTGREKKAWFIAFLAKRIYSFNSHQRAKKVVSSSPGLVDFVTGLVNSVLNLPKGQEKFFGEFTVINPAHQKNFSGYIKWLLG